MRRVFVIPRMRAVGCGRPVRILVSVWAALLLRRRRVVPRLGLVRLFELLLVLLVGLLRGRGLVLLSRRRGVHRRGFGGPWRSVRVSIFIRRGEILGVLVSPFWLKNGVLRR